MKRRDFIKETLAGLERDGLRRNLQSLSPLAGGRISLEGRPFLNLSSNDYLGLSQHEELKEAAAEAARRWGVGAGASRLITGNHQFYELLEEKIARFKRKEAAIVFSSGYMANIGVLSSLIERGDRVFSDELNHASIIDGIRMSRGQLFIYRHKDADHLEYLLENSSGVGKAIIVTDTVFSMDGDVAPLERLVEIRRKHGCLLVVDEAHATGVIGEHGRGVAEYLNLEGEIDVTVGTFSKALGSYGAFAAGKRDLIDFFLNRARSLIYTTGLPPAVIATNIAALGLVEKYPDLRQKLRDNTHLLHKALQEMGFRLPPAETAILPLMVGETTKVIELSEGLFQEGIIAKPIRPPTVPEGTARLRITASAAHRREDLEAAIAAFERCGKKSGMITGGR
ncbi:MAG: 8-amino-7-oxononanoate synthase [Smithellaceae bacterium]|nr:8-amino-7-oxononanoate synthase [Smithellaceae bacterium]